MDWEVIKENLIVKVLLGFIGLCTAIVVLSQVYHILPVYQTMESVVLMLKITMLTDIFLVFAVIIIILYLQKEKKIEE